MRYDAAYGTGIMAKMSRNTGYCRSFHLEIRNLKVSETETLESVKHVRHGQRHTEDTALRAIES